MDPTATVIPKEQPELPILEHGIVINPVDTALDGDRRNRGRRKLNAQIIENIRDRLPTYRTRIQIWPDVY